ncbi:MAG: hypothetical protein ACE5GY_10250 [Thermodesulfobacteriota bacterium]
MFKKLPSGIRLAVLGASAGAFTLVFATGGCISRNAYNKNISRLASQLQNERAARAKDAENYEKKLREKSVTLTELTNRYITLQKESSAAHRKLGSLKGDLDTLLRDIAELKAVIFQNVKGSVRNEMMIKLMEMQYRVKSLLKNKAAPGE